MIDKARQRCRDSCPEDADPVGCGCEDLEVWDVGNFFWNMMGAYLESNGQRIRTEPCLSDQSCADFRAAPPPRTAAELR